MPATLRSSPDQALSIVVISDGEFLPRLYSLAASIAANMPSATLHAHLVNIADPRDSARLLELHARTELTFVHAQLDGTTSHLGLDGVTRFTEKAGFCVNLRGPAIQRLLLDGHERVLFLDADCIVRRDLAPLVQLMETADILIHKRPHAAEYMRVCAAVIGVRNTPASLHFFDHFNDRVRALGDRLFFSDQLAFHQVALELGDETDIRHLPAEYIDWEFLPDSPIWTGKGQRKYSNETYLREERAFRS